MFFRLEGGCVVTTFLALKFRCGRVSGGATHSKNQSRLRKLKLVSLDIRACLLRAVRCSISRCTWNFESPVSLQKRRAIRKAA